MDLVPPPCSGAVGAQRVRGVVCPAGSVLYQDSSTARMLVHAPGKSYAYLRFATHISHLRAACSEYEGGCGYDVAHIWLAVSPSQISWHWPVPSHPRTRERTPDSMLAASPPHPVPADQNTHYPQRLRERVTRLNARLGGGPLRFFDDPLVMARRLWATMPAGLAALAGADVDAAQAPAACVLDLTAAPGWRGARGAARA